MKNIFILSLFSLLLLAVRCPKNDGGLLNSQTKTPPETLPPATQTGANTFGCLLNGKVWLPQRIGYPYLDVQYYKGLFNLWAAKDSGTQMPGDTQGINQGITWSYKYIYRPGTYYFKSAPGGGASGAAFINILFYGTTNSNCSYDSNDIDSSNTYVTITKLDSVNRIISGTFNLTYIPSINETYGSCDTVKITNGRFDAIYTY